MLTEDWSDIFAKSQPVLITSKLSQFNIQSIKLSQFNNIQSIQYSMAEKLHRMNSEMSFLCWRCKEGSTPQVLVMQSCNHFWTTLSVYCSCLLLLCTFMKWMYPVYVRKDRNMGGVLPSCQTKIKSVE